MNIKKFCIKAAIFFISLYAYGCYSSDYINVKVKKSAFIADCYEINRDSLITGAIRISTMGQRYYYKS